MKQVETIARLDLPKQRCTAPISIVIRKQTDKDGIFYSTHLLNRETNSLFQGEYMLTFEQAMQDFKSLCDKWLAYSPTVYEEYCDKWLSEPPTVSETSNKPEGSV